MDESDRYESLLITNDEASNIIHSSKDWISFAENPHGEVYWNKANGEIIWKGNKEGESNYQKLKVHGPI